MKLPNGYGTVYKLSGNRRNPYVARKTIGWKQDEKTNKKKQIFATIGYFPDRPTALQALAEYNNNPYDLQLSQITFAELYKLWANEKFDENTNRSTKRNYINAYNRAKAIHNMKMSDIRPRHLQSVLDENSKASRSSCERIRSLFRQMYDWCIANDCIKKNYAEGLTISVEQIPEPKKAFTNEEIKILWDNQNNEHVKIVLILIYSGVRIGELLALKKEDIELENQMFSVKQAKTKSGIRRVPIADKVLPFWKYFLSISECNYVFTNKSRKEALRYFNFKDNYFTPLREALGFNHTIHETRHTCISQLTMQNANPTMIKFIVGHKAVMSLTERVYTHIDDKELLNTINLIP